MDWKVGNSDKCIKCRKIIIGKCKRSSTPYLVWGIIYHERNLPIYDIIQVNIFSLLAKRFYQLSRRIGSQLCKWNPPKIYRFNFDGILLALWIWLVLHTNSCQHSLLNKIQTICCSTVLLILMPFHSTRQSVFTRSISGVVVRLVHALW